MSNSLILCDSCDHYNTATSSRKWVGNVTIGAGRTGNGLVGSTAGTIGTKTFPLNPLLVAGYAFNYTSLMTEGIFFDFYNPGTLVRIRVFLRSDGSFRVALLGTFGQEDTSAASEVRVQTSQWYYFELYVSHVVGASQSVSIILKLNGEILISDTLASATVPSAVGFTTAIYSGHGGTSRIDDIYISKGIFYGDVRIYVIRPDGDDAPSQWTPNNGGAHYLEVDDITPDDLTSYLYTANIGDVDMVTLEDIGISGEVKGIQANYMVQKDESGDASFRPEYEFNSTSYETAVDKYPSHNSWIDFIDPMSENPVTLTDFTISDINAMKMGIKRTS